MALSCEFAPALNSATVRQQREFAPAGAIATTVSGKDEGANLGGLMVAKERGYTAKLVILEMGVASAFSVAPTQMRDLGNSWNKRDS